MRAPSGLAPLIGAFVKRVLRSIVLDDRRLLGGGGAIAAAAARIDSLVGVRGQDRLRSLRQYAQRMLDFKRRRAAGESIEEIVRARERSTHALLVAYLGSMVFLRGTVLFFTNRQALLAGVLSLGGQAALTGIALRQATDWKLSTATLLFTSAVGADYPGTQLSVLGVGAAIALGSRLLTADRVRSALLSDLSGEERPRQRPPRQRALSIVGAVAAPPQPSWLSTLVNQLLYGGNGGLFALVPLLLFLVLHGSGSSDVETLLKILDAVSSA